MTNLEKLATPPQESCCDDCWEKAFKAGFMAAIEQYERQKWHTHELHNMAMSIHDLKEWANEPVTNE